MRIAESTVKFDFFRKILFTMRIKDPDLYEYDMDPDKYGRCCCLPTWVQGHTSTRDSRQTTRRSK